MNILLFRTGCYLDSIFYQDADIISGFQNRGHIVKIETLPARKCSRFISILRFISCIKKHKVDLVVTSTIKEISTVGIAAKLCRVPTVWRVGKEINIIDERKHHSFLIDHFVFEHIFDMEYQIDQVFQPKTTNLKDEISNIRASWGVKDDDIVVGITTQLGDDSTIIDLLKVFEKFASTQRNLYLVISGVGSYKSFIKQKTVDIMINWNVIFTEVSFDPQLQINAYDICCLDSYGQGEPHTIHEFAKGMTKSIYEYLKAKKSIIVSNSDKVRDTLKHQYNCLIYETGDWEILHLHINTIYSNSQYAEELSLNAYNTAKQYTINKFISELEEAKQYHTYGEDLYEL